ncbi:MAG TPA: PfkB family carbohydrate kinase, partial [Anaerolineae bacterium]|nr:PfkB family carbohydrate kinase [Anaerolineae bacterium]
PHRRRAVRARRRPGAVVPRPIAEWLRANGHVPDRRYEAHDWTDRSLRGLPLPIDDWPSFDALFDWHARPVKDSAGTADDWCGLALRDWPEKALGLPLVSVLKVDQAEAEVLTGELDARTAAMLLAGWGAREVLLTHATGVTVCAEGRVWWAPFVPRGLNGRTGRGDTCLAAYLARRLTAGPAEACRFAAAVTSLKLEVPGPLQASAEEIARLYAELEVKAI